MIIGKDHKLALSVIVERQTRYVLINRLENYTALEVRESIEKRLKTLEPQLVKNITCDQGKEMAEHERLASSIKMKVIVDCLPAHSDYCSIICAFLQEICYLIGRSADCQMVLDHLPR